MICADVLDRDMFKPTVLSFLQFIIINNLYIFNRDAVVQIHPPQPKLLGPARTHG